VTKIEKKMKENLIDHHWQEFLVNPLNVVDRLFNQMNGESSVDEFHNFIQEQLKSLIKSDSSRLDEIPYLNNRQTNYDNIRNRSLVRYRCMVQDMFNPEIFAAVLNSSTGKKINLYTDSVNLDEKYVISSNKNQIADRFIYYMISIPGVNEWVRDEWDKEGNIENISQQLKVDQQLNQQQFSNQQVNSETDQSQSKRHLDDEPSSSKKKKVDEDQTTNQTSNKSKDYCTPIKSEANLNKPVIVKVYDTKDLNVKLNDIVEIIGVIEFPTNENYDTKVTSDEKIKSKDHPEISSMLNNLDLDHEDYAYSELPRIHALQVKRLDSINPFVQFNSSNCCEKSSTYTKLVSLFEKIFFGDKLTTQYFICWLVSRVYKIQDSLPIGNFPINISNLNKIPNDEHNVYIKRFYEVLESLCTHSMNFPVTIAELNNRIMNPYKDRDNVKLQSGLLQLPTNFSLVLDETSLQPGSLKEMGIKNLSVLKELIAWQSIEYDHLFYTQRINTDINVLVFSEGKSLFDVNCEIKLKPVESYTNIDEQFNLINLCLDDKLKNDFRNYLNYVRTLNCDIPNDLQKKIQDDFVQMRKDSSAKTGPKICSDDLHRFLAISRLLAMSEGSNKLSDEHWEKAKKMELERRNRSAY